MQTRRSFIRNTCSFCVSAAGMGFLLTELESCKPSQIATATGNKNMISVPLVSMSEKKTLVVRNNNIDFDILLVKKSATEFSALQMLCTHQWNPLTATSSGLFCPSHGSAYDFDGNVTQEPAIQSLKKYDCSVENDQIIIHLKS